MTTRLKAITRPADHEVFPRGTAARATRVYIAAPYTFRDEARRVRAMMHSNYWPLRSVARWLDRPTLPPCEWTSEVLAMEARECIEDINAADAALVLHPDESTGGGLLVEIGIAVQRGLPIFVAWGNKQKQKPVFFSLPQIRVVTLLNDALDALAAIPAR
jgi:nucleoside 2-deoxyribosyltransferase